MMEAISPQNEENSIEEVEQDCLESIQKDYAEYNEIDESLEDHENTDIRKDIEDEMKNMQGKIFSNNNVDLNFSASFYSQRHLDMESLKGIITRDSNHGLTGMKNLGNTCYINTAVQCLSHTIELVFFYLTKVYENEVNKSSGNALLKKGLKPGQLCSILERVLNPLWLGTSKVLSPNELKSMVSNSIPQFNNSNGQDAHEMLNYLLDMIHEDTNSGAVQLGNPRYNETLLPKMSNESDISAAKRFWNHYKERNSSIIVDYFTGQLKNTIECASCDNVSVTFQSFVTLPLAIPIMKAVDVFIVPSINIKSTIKLTIFVSESALFIDLRNYLRKYIRSDIKVDRFRALLVNAKSQTAKFTKNTENIYQTSKKGHIFVYEVDDRFPEGEDYYPLITLVRVKSEDGQTQEIYNNMSYSYPRMFPVVPLDTVKTLRANIYGYLRKYYPLHESFSQKYLKICSNYQEGKFLDESEYEKVIMEEYKLLFSDSNNSEYISQYLLDYPFTVSLVSSNNTNNTKSKVLFSSQREEFISTLADNSKIEKLIELIKSGYKLVIEITKSSKELESKMNSMLSIKDKENKNSKSPTLYDCLDHFSLYEKLDKGNEFYCEKCKKLQNAFKKLEIFYVPKNFVIVLNRFEVKRLTKFSIQILKNNTFVSYPINSLDLMKYVTAQEPRALYDLYAVSQHSGSTEGGHYATACRNFGKWYEMDDMSIFPSEEEMTVSREGYILLYRRKEKNK